MPDVRVRYPKELLVDTGSKTAFLDMVAEIAAAHLECAGYDGSPVGLTPDQIDVQLNAYEWEDVRFNAVVIVEICAYGYPDRMRTISQRLTAIGEALATSAFIGYEPIVRGMVPVSLSYLPIPKGSWVATT